VADMTRDEALNHVAFLIETGWPIHPRRRDWLREIIGETTPEEEAMLALHRPYPARLQAINRRKTT
jgi:hypothetical protein